MDQLYDYRIKRWGSHYFDIGPEGNVIVKTHKDSSPGDLHTLVCSLVERGIEPPILIRFNGILRDRINYINNAFQKAIKQFGYRNSYHTAFPIKVNPQQHVVEIVQAAGQEHALGLEVGSKPELIAVMTLEHNPSNFLLCNGYKDLEYVSLALMANKLGRNTIIIIEQLYELKLVIAAAEELGLEAQVGIRMKLSSKGTGIWDSSGGEHSKFGLFPHEIVACLEQLNAYGKSDWLKLLHFHLGSQITSIEAIKKALNEGARMYTEIAKEFSSLNIFDVGGGLAIDYDGTNSTSDFSMNYSVEEYARDVVSSIGEACLNAGLNDPVIITESGRATVTHHSVLIAEVIDVASIPRDTEELPPPPTKHDILEWIGTMYEGLNLENCRETFHDLVDLKERILEEFVHAKLSLKERAYAERVYRLLIAKIRATFDKLAEPPEEMEIIDKILRETYFCNFSVFQSLPDSWAIGQLFPIMPIHRLHEKPTRQAVLADISCDSDGKIDHFASKKGSESYLLLHEYKSEPYYLGIFLVGAYQEVLGGLHNLFGDTNVVHVELEENGDWDITRHIEGDKIEEVLSYVQYFPEKLMERLQTLIEKSLKTGQLTAAESAKLKRKFKQALESYTYLVV